LFDKDIPGAAMGADIAVWLAPLPGGSFVRDRLKIGGQAAIAIGGDESFAG
jgi:hypothetical protein